MSFPLIKQGIHYFFQFSKSMKYSLRSSLQISECTEGMTGGFSGDPREYLGLFRWCFTKRYSMFSKFTLSGRIGRWISLKIWFVFDAALPVSSSTLLKFGVLCGVRWLECLTSTHLIAEVKNTCPCPAVGLVSTLVNTG